MKRHNEILKRNKTEEADLIFRGNGGDYCQIDKRQKIKDER